MSRQPCEPGLLKTRTLGFSRGGSHACPELVLSEVEGRSRRAAGLPGSHARPAILETARYLGDSFSKEEMDEKALIANAQRGEVPAFNQLVLTYQSMVYNLAYRILGDADAAADASQDAFLSAFRAIKKFRGGSFKAWLLRIATNACYDQLRYKQRRPTSSLEALFVETDQPSSFTDPTERPEDYALRQELGRVIQAGLNTLPPDQRVALALSDIQGLSYQEIAEITRSSLGTVKSRLSRGRTKLRDYLLEQGELLPARYRLKSREKAAHV